MEKMAAGESEQGSPNSVDAVITQFKKLMVYTEKECIEVIFTYFKGFLSRPASSQSGPYFLDQSFIEGIYESFRRILDLRRIYVKITATEDADVAETINSQLNQVSHKLDEEESLPPSRRIITLSSENSSTEVVTNSDECGSSTDNEDAHRGTPGKSSVTSATKSGQMKVLPHNDHGNGSKREREQLSSTMDESPHEAADSNSGDESSEVSNPRDTLLSLSRELETLKAEMRTLKIRQDTLSSASYDNSLRMISSLEGSKSPISGRKALKKKGRLFIRKRGVDFPTEKEGGNESLGTKLGEKSLNSPRSPIQKSDSKDQQKKNTRRNFSNKKRRKKSTETSLSAEDNKVKVSFKNQDGALSPFMNRRNSRVPSSCVQCLEIRWKKGSIRSNFSGIKQALGGNLKKVVSWKYVRKNNVVIYYSREKLALSSSMPQQVSSVVDTNENGKIVLNRKVPEDFIKEYEYVKNKLCVPAIIMKCRERERSPEEFIESEDVEMVRCRKRTKKC